MRPPPHTYLPLLIHPCPYSLFLTSPSLLQLFSTLFLFSPNSDLASLPYFIFPSSSFLLLISSSSYSHSSFFLSRLTFPSHLSFPASSFFSISPHLHGSYSSLFCARTLEQSMGARNRVVIGLSYRPARLHRLAESIPGIRKNLKYCLCFLHSFSLSSFSIPPFLTPSLSLFFLPSFLLLKNWLIWNDASWELFNWKYFIISFNEHLAGNFGRGLLYVPHIMKIRDMATGFVSFKK